MVFGYHRTSTKEQNLDRGIIEIENYAEQKGLDLEKIYTDQQTGKNFNRPAYELLKEVLREGDELIITEIDRLGRDKKQTSEELRQLKEMGVKVRILELPTTLTDASDEYMALLNDMISNLLIEVLTTLAESEMKKRVKRQSEGIEAMKLRGEWDKYGRPEIMSLDDFAIAYQGVLDGYEKPFAVMKSLGMKKSTFYWYVKKLKEAQKNP